MLNVPELGFLATSTVPVDLSPVDRAQILHKLTHWFEATPKRPRADLADQMALFKRELAALASDCRIQIERGEPRLYVSPHLNDVVTRLRHGTLWFDGCPNLERQLLTVIQE